MMKSWIIIAYLIGTVLVLGASIIAITTYKSVNKDTGRPISNFEECEAAGYPVMESYPRQCRANGQTFVEKLLLPAPTLK